MLPPPTSAVCCTRVLAGHNGPSLFHTPPFPHHLPPPHLISMLASPTPPTDPLFTLGFKTLNPQPLETFSPFSACHSTSSATPPPHPAPHPRVGQVRRELPRGVVGRRLPRRRVRLGTACALQQPRHAIQLALLDTHSALQLQGFVWKYGVAFHADLRGQQTRRPFGLDGLGVSSSSIAMRPVSHSSAHTVPSRCMPSSCSDRLWDQWDLHNRLTRCPPDACSDRWEQWDFIVD
eukprot:365100-Chlamydomonas_euryale.AAC.2